MAHPRIVDRDSANQDAVSRLYKDGTLSIVHPQTLLPAFITFLAALVSSILYLSTFTSRKVCSITALPLKLIINGNFRQLQHDVNQQSFPW